MSEHLGWEEAGLAGLASLPVLQQSQNPDVARLASATAEIAHVVIWRLIVIRILGFLLLPILVLFWFGSATFIILAHVTGVGTLVVVLLALFGPLAIFSRSLPVRVITALVIMGGFGLGIWSAATGFFSTVH